MSETKTKKPGRPRAQRPKAASDAQRAAMIEGRQQAQAVRHYLEALKAVNGPKRRGRKRTPESISRRLEAIEVELAAEDLDPVRELKLVQEKLDLGNELSLLQRPTLDPAEYEADFVKVAKAYSERQGISATAWRALGVPRAVLKRAELV